MINHLISTIKPIRFEEGALIAFSGGIEVRSQSYAAPDGKMEDRAQDFVRRDVWYQIYGEVAVEFSRLLFHTVMMANTLIVAEEQRRQVMELCDTVGQMLKPPNLRTEIADGSVCQWYVYGKEPTTVRVEKTQPPHFPGMPGQGPKISIIRLYTVRDRKHPNSEPKIFTFAEPEGIALLDLRPL